MFRSQYIKISTTNSGTPVRTLEAAHAALAAGTAASAGGRLVEGLVGADIDTDDPVTGDACAETLVAWCVRMGLPYLVRESGRPGGRHVIAAITHKTVPVNQWHQICLNLTRSGTTVDDRTGKVLRLLTAPHRLGYPSPVVSCTLTPQTVKAAIPFDPRKYRTSTPTRGVCKDGVTSRKRRHSGTSQVPHHLATNSSAGTHDHSRSGREYGQACAMARRGYTARQAYSELCVPGSKTAERGPKWFRRYLWLPAVTVVAAESGLDETAAWQRAQSQCPTECRREGRTWWRGLWQRALDEARTDRPRRYRLQTDAPADNNGIDTGQLEALRSGFHTAINEVLSRIDPRRRHSVYAALYALAPALMSRKGSMSLRDISLRARIDLGTARRAITTAIEHGLLVLTHQYSGGTKDCHAYGVGPAAKPHIQADSKSSPHTSCSTPPAGSSSLTLLLTRYAHDRRRWARRSDALSCLVLGERLANSTHPAAKLLRSIHRQRRWWTGLNAHEQAIRRENRRSLLCRIGESDRDAWFDWLKHREIIVDILDALPVSAGTRKNRDLILTAPPTIHRGMADPRWRDWVRVA